MTRRTKLSVLDFFRRSRRFFSFQFSLFQLGLKAEMNKLVPALKQTMRVGNWLIEMFFLFFWNGQLWKSTRRRPILAPCSSATNATGASCRAVPCSCTSPSIQRNWISSADTVRPKCERSRSATSTKGYTRPTKRPTSVRTARNNSTRWSIYGRISNCTPTEQPTILITQLFDKFLLDVPYN